GPVPGVNVVVDGTNNGAQTDFDGNYSLANVPSDATLVFSYIGYASQSVAVNGQTTVNVTLSEDVQALNEVVVIGYGTTTVKDATGAVTAVTSEEFNKGVIASPEQLIQGKSAGVQISQTSGEPGAGIDIRIRGANSVRSNNNPLYVVDGIPLSGGTTPEGSNVGFGTSSAKNPLNFLNPNDIESISILKDASATAIYGSRGANGVVIITTKSGRGSRGGSFDYSSSLSISEVRSTYDIMNANEYLAASRLFTTSVADRDFGNDTDWQDFVYRTSTSINNNLSYSNNYGSGNVRATFGYGNQFGVIQNSNLERITGRINLQQRLVNDKLKLGFQGSMSRVNSQSPPLSGSAGFRGDLLGAAYSANPTWPIEADFDSQNGLTNPANLLAYTSDKTNTNRYLLNASAQYNFTPALYGKVNLGYDKSESFRGAATSRLARNVDQGAFGNGVAAINELNNENKLLEATLGYDTDLGNSKLDAVVGYSFQDFNVNGRNISGFGYTTDSLDGMINNLESSANSIESILQGDYQQYGYSNNYAGSAPGSNIFVNRLFPSVTSEFIPTVPNDIAVRALFTDTFDNTDELQSYFGRVNYSIADKYLFTATVRADGSSRFGSDNQYGVFPSGAFAWKMDNEAFVGENVSTLKLRLGVGITGNQEGLGYGNFVSRQRFGGGDVIDDGGTLNIPGTTFVAFAEPGLKWEETLQYAAGLDFGFDNDRLYGSVDVYRKETTDLLFRTDAAQPAVQQFIFRNLPNSKVVNEGVELALGYEVIETDDASFSVNFNVAYNSNLIESLSGQFNAGTIRGQGLTGAFAQKLQQNL
ncbi:MAG: SusC/RagA family TonB-linked outer membrane protein, partial [Marinirhabdus sp.]